MPRPRKDARRTDSQSRRPTRSGQADRRARRTKSVQPRRKASRSEERGPNWLDVSVSRIRAHGPLAIIATVVIALAYVFRSAGDDKRDRRPPPAVSPGDVAIAGGRERSRSITLTFHILIEDRAAPVRSRSSDSLPVRAGAVHPIRPPSHQP
jgi:hypothetical protein